MPPTTTSEDFSFFQQRVPGLFFFLGVTPPSQDWRTAATNHSPLFQADEGALPVGMRALGHLTLDFLTARVGPEALLQGLTSSSADDVEGVERFGHGLAVSGAGAEHVAAEREAGDGHLDARAGARRAGLGRDGKSSTRTSPALFSNSASGGPLAERVRERGRPGRGRSGGRRVSRSGSGAGALRSARSATGVDAR